MKRRGTWPFGSTFFSICSMHRDGDSDCKLCKIGMWHSDIGLITSKALHKTWPWLWRKWKNRSNSPTKKFLESVFPNLRK